MKKTYTNPEIQVICLASADAITTSGDTEVGAFTVSRSGMGFGGMNEGWIW